MVGLLISKHSLEDRSHLPLLVVAVLSLPSRLLERRSGVAKLKRAESLTLAHVVIRGHEFFQIESSAKGTGTFW